MYPARNRIYSPSHDSFKFHLVNQLCAHKNKKVAIIGGE